MNPTRIRHSIILNVHNKDWLIDKVVAGIRSHTRGGYELIVVLDGCTDRSETVVRGAAEGMENLHIFSTPDVFETKANNAGARRACGDFLVFMQDDMVIQEPGWNLRMQKPFDAFGDVFAVTAKTAHNWRPNPESKHLGMREDLDNCWCDICRVADVADQTNTPRNIFAVRASVNRGPLMIDAAEFRKVGCFDEIYAPLDMDEHDLMFRVRSVSGKVCGCYWIGFECKAEWGGTRVNGSTAPWMHRANHKNMKIFYSRHGKMIRKKYPNEDRPLD